MELIERLEAIRQERGMSESAFAHSLGISRTMWVATRQGKYPPRFQVLAGAVRELGDDDPAVITDVIDFLREAERKGE